MTDTEQSILNATEKMIRKGGYYGFSFRNIADEIGIKSSSVHYHFETKEKLGIAITKRYTENFMSYLGEPADLQSNGVNPVIFYITAFRNTIVNDGGICLCGILGSETSVLPETISAEISLFFDKNLTWLEKAYRQLGHASDAKKKAFQTLSLLEGAMMISITKKGVDYFDQSTQLLIQDAEFQKPYAQETDA